MMGYWPKSPNFDKDTNISSMSQAFQDVLGVILK
jgi:hypothetical protein